MEVYVLGEGSCSKLVFISIGVTQYIHVDYIGALSVQALYPLRLAGTYVLLL